MEQLTIHSHDHCCDVCPWSRLKQQNPWLLALLLATSSCLDNDSCFTTFWPWSIVKTELLELQVGRCRWYGPYARSRWFLWVGDHFCGRGVGKKSPCWRIHIWGISAHIWKYLKISGPGTKLCVSNCFWIRIDSKEIKPIQNLTTSIFASWVYISWLSQTSLRF